MAVNEHDDKAGPDEADGRIAALYRDASREEPPARLDRVIARAARAPAGSLSEPQRVPWWVAWRMPFAVAALAVVSVTLVTLMVEEDAARVVRVPPSAPAVSESAPAKEDAPTVPALPRAPEPKPERAVEPPAAPRKDMRARDDRSAPDAAPTRAPVVQGPVPAEAPAAADAAAKPSASPGALSAPMPAAKPRPAPTPSATIGRRGLESEAPSQRARPSPEVARHVLELDREAPAVWIERVLALRKEGRFSEADGVLAEFRQRYPGVQVPPDLQ